MRTRRFNVVLPFFRSFSVVGGYDAVKRCEAAVAALYPVKQSPRSETLAALNGSSLSTIDSHAGVY
jgi:hypothetical protein